MRQTNSVLRGILCLHKQKEQDKKNKCTNVAHVRYLLVYSLRPLYISASFKPIIYFHSLFSVEKEKLSDWPEFIHLERDPRCESLVAEGALVAHHALLFSPQGVEMSTPPGT